MKGDKREEDTKQAAVSSKADGEGAEEVAMSKEAGGETEPPVAAVASVSSSNKKGGQTLLRESTSQPGAFAISNPLSEGPIVESLQSSVAMVALEAQTSSVPENSGISVLPDSVAMASAKPISVAVADPVENSEDDRESTQTDPSNAKVSEHDGRVRIFVFVALIVLVVLVVVLSLVLSNQDTPLEITDNEMLRRREDMINFLGEVVDPNAFDPNHPQASADRIRALQWIVEEDEMQVSIPVTIDDPAAKKILERYALAVFYFSTNGEQWKNQYSFLSRYDACNWVSGFVDDWSWEMGEPAKNAKGVVCNPDGSVSDIRLWWNEMSGTIPEEIRFLDNIKGFTVSGNNLYGSIPSLFANFSQLSTFSVSDNCFEGTLPEWVNDNDMEIITLYNNKALTGSLEPYCHGSTALREGVVAVIADYGVDCTCCTLCDTDQFQCDDPIYNVTWNALYYDNDDAYDSRNNLLLLKKDCITEEQREVVAETCPCIVKAGARPNNGIDIYACDDCSTEGSRPTTGN